MNEYLLFKVVSTSARMILTSVLATEASGSGTRVSGTSKTKVRMLMVGVEAAGKVTILQKLKLGERVTIHHNDRLQRGRTWSTRTLVSPCGTSGAMTSSALCGIITAKVRTV